MKKFEPFGLRRVLASGAVAVAVSLMAACSQTAPAPSGAANSASQSGLVYFLVPDTIVPRWTQQDAPAFQAKLAELNPDLQVEILNANNDAVTQTSQMNVAITKGAKAIVLAAVDENQTSGLLNDAERAGIPVVLYEKAAKGGPASVRLFYSFDKVGELQGQAAYDDFVESGQQTINLARIFVAHGKDVTEAFAAAQDRVLKPLIESGKVKLVCDDWGVKGTNDELQRLAEQCLTRNENQVNAFMAINDAASVPLGAALESAGLAGEVPIYGGQDADIIGLQNIIRGIQPATVYKPFKTQGEAAAELVDSLIKTGELPAGHEYGIYDNGTAEIPTYELAPTQLRLDNVWQPVTDGVYAWADVCVGDVADSKICQENADQ